jgi:hypothetical protein
MAESSLSLGYADLRKAVGRFLGFGGTSGNWTADQIDEIAGYLDAGLRRFETAYDWRFLRVTTTIATVADDYDTTLPDNFGYMLGDLTFATVDNGWDRIRLVTEDEIRKLRQSPTNTTGKPKFAAVRPRTTDGTTGQRFEIIYWPTPDAIYTLSYQYRILTSQLSSGAPYPYGGMLHAETIKAAIMAEAERTSDDEEGVHEAKYQKLLAQSIMVDQRGEAEYFGYNGDHSDLGTQGFNRRDWMNSTTVGGVQY